MLFICDRYGQLGNRLSRAVHVFAASIEYNVRVADPVFFPYASYFTGTRASALCEFRPKLNTANQKHRNIEVPTAVQSLCASSVRRAASLARLIDHKNTAGRTLHASPEHPIDLQSSEVAEIIQQRRMVFLTGCYFDAGDWIERHRETICQHFSLHHTHQEQVDLSLSEARAQSSMVVGVHIRQGDYASWKGGKYFYSVKQYRTLMQSTVSAFPNENIKFLVCSDAELKSSDFGSLPVVIGPGNPVREMYALAGCDLLIGPPSTFSKWAAYYGQRPRVVIEDYDRAASSVIESISELNHSAQAA